MLQLWSVVALGILPGQIECIWPVPYEVNLHQEEVFVISDDSEDLSTDEEEMLGPNVKREAPIEADPRNDKYYRIHQMAMRHNKPQHKMAQRKKVIAEANFDLEDAIPWQGGFVDKNGDFIQPENGNVFYLNEMAKSLIDEKIEQKREDEPSIKDDEESYDYNSFKSEYSAEIKQAEKLRATLNFTDAKEDESVKEALEAVVEVKEPKNCTQEETKGIGLAAIKCIVRDIKVTKNKNSIYRLLEKLAKIVLIWFSVYAIIAIPCWCQKGWCCCCCPCKFCRPIEQIHETKQFFMQNPPGVYHTKAGEKVTYQPTTYEIYTQNRLERALLTL